MLSYSKAVAFSLCLAAAASAVAAEEDEGWFSVFNGKDLTGWKVSENPATFSVQNGELVTKGPRAHAFYVGDVGGADFTNFEWKCEILTKPNSNSGMYFHTEYQEEGYPAKGHEVQVNQTHGDRRKTGGLYAVQDVMDESPVKDNEWYTQHVIVNGKRVIVKVNGKVTCDYTEPDDYTPPADRPGRQFSHGTIALQGHDPASEVHFRKLMVKPLD
ncbi:hypothetical protein Pla175_13610 [Pirellulimonas nuda]|uniref:3-keto-alpha-glucoside-1,2-lyase/3-keto-2-hydroxy-glucal hydratase domain-containing protein n=1 Tax=Pirellulimonas nuda TaxID=2528009 RepID=A0A518D940_9BACT|nr:DUF1080 domain-containing protein [Pirellulimonas nuda]QDU87992.1 hypothetical protein Pla175_13610 [Pirellulimonas nuda]